MSADYARFGRQIALPALGAAGQQRLGASPVCAPSAQLPLASQLWRAAGGGDGVQSIDDPRSATAAEVEATPPSLMLGVAAWCCVESARAALSLGPPASLPEALRRRLDPTR